MFCPYCGASGLGSDGICQACGQQVRSSSVELEVTPADEDTGDSCPNCGSPLGTDEIFCGQCGTRVSLEPEEEQPATGAAGAWVSAPPKPTARRLSSEPRQQLPDWSDEPTEDYDGPTELIRRTGYPRASLRGFGGSPGNQPGGQRATAGLRLTGKPPVSPPRSQAALLISLLCFFASLLSGAAAIWLAVAH